MSTKPNPLAGQDSYRELFRTGNIFPWLYPPVDFLHFDKFGSVALPAKSASATVLQFTVPRGRNGRITHLGVDVVANGGTAFVVGVVPATLTFNFFRDASQGLTGPLFPDYESFSFLPGSVIQPIPFVDGLLVVENQQVTLIVNNVNLTKDTQFVAARAVGYFYPKNREPKESGNK